MDLRKKEQLARLDQIFEQLRADKTGQPVKQRPTTPPPTPLVWGGLEARHVERVLSGYRFSDSELAQLTDKQIEHYHAIRPAQ